MLLGTTAARWDKTRWGKEGIPIIINLGNVIYVEGCETSGTQICTRVRFVDGKEELIKVPIAVFIGHMCNAFIHGGLIRIPPGGDIPAPDYGEPK